MKKIYKRTLAFLSVIAACTLLAGCGCGKEKETDAASSQVLKITITPEATPIPVPEDVNPDAVVTNGNMTMVNEYLAGGSNGA